MADYTEDIEMAREMIDESGQDVTWIKKPIITPNPEKPWENIPGEPVSHTVKMVFVNKYRDTSWLKYLTGTSVPTGSQYALMAQTSFVPEIQDTVIRDGVTLAIEDIKPIAPSGVTILSIIYFSR